MIAFPSKWAKALTENLYYVSVDDINTLSREHLAAQGYTITGIDEIDERRRHIKTQVYVPIIDSSDRLTSILDYFVAGAPIDFTEMSDIVDIVEIIGGYLGEWELHIQNSINIQVGPFKDLIESLYKLHTRLFAMIDNDSFKEVENKATPQVAIGSPLPFNPTGMNDRKEFKRPEYQDVFGNLGKAVRDRIVSENDY